jgi:hypothetical protein
VTAEEAIGQLRLRPFDAIYLDHDLEDEAHAPESHTNTGSEVVRFMCSESLIARDVPIVVHSLNQPASESMISKLTAAGFSNVQRIHWLTLAKVFK